MSRKLAVLLVEVAVLVALFLWAGVPGPASAGLLAMGAFRYFIWDDV